MGNLKKCEKLRWVTIAGDYISAEKVVIRNQGRDVMLQHSAKTLPTLMLSTLQTHFRCCTARVPTALHRRLELWGCLQGGPVSFVAVTGFDLLQDL